MSYVVKRIDTSRISRPIFDGIPGKNLISVEPVAGDFSSLMTSGSIVEFTLEKSHTNVQFVAKVSQIRRIEMHTPDVTQERNGMSVMIVEKDFPPVAY